MAKQESTAALYDDAYYENNVAASAVLAAPVMAGFIAGELRPRAVVDVGCGTGALLSALAERGVQGIGYEWSDAALMYCITRGLRVMKFDLEQHNWLGDVYDVAICMEVAEHVDARHADACVKLLCQLAPVVVFSAAHPEQGGVGHVNEQPARYWIAKFKALGYLHEHTVSHAWREAWRNTGRVATWYWQNLMIFSRS